MNDFPALQKIRIGCVRYLNAKPLIGAYPGEVVFEHPARLAAMLARDEIDVGLAPTFEWLRSPRYLLADEIAIASRGPVFSVVLAHRGEIESIRTIALDSASLTSVFLLRTLFAEFFKSEPMFVSEKNRKAHARLLIGNQAIAFRRRHGDAFCYLDLGEEWTKRTGLPFVYAMWMMRPQISDPRAIADELRALKNLGSAQIENLARDEKQFGAEFARRYLGGHIRYDLGVEEKRGIEKWRELLKKHRLIENAAPLRFV